MGLLLMAVLLSSPVSTPVRFFVVRRLQGSVLQRLGPHLSKPNISRPAPPVQIGDWGRQGSANQTAVAQLMGLVAARVRPHFVVSTGGLVPACGVVFGIWF